MKGWKTMIVAAAIAVGGVLETADWVDLVGEENAGLVLLVLASAMAALRAITTTPVGGEERSVRRR